LLKVVQHVYQVQVILASLILQQTNV
jgi:hypothetical protein